VGHERRAGFVPATLVATHGDGQMRTGRRGISSRREATALRALTEGSADQVRFRTVREYLRTYAHAADAGRRPAAVTIFIRAVARRIAHMIRHIESQAKMTTAAV